MGACVAEVLRAGLQLGCYGVADLNRWAVARESEESELWISELAGHLADARAVLESLEGLCEGSSSLRDVLHARLGWLGVSLTNGLMTPFEVCRIADECALNPELPEAESDELQWALEGFALAREGRVSTAEATMALREVLARYVPRVASVARQVRPDLECE
jgi:hypothetical protein